LTVAEVGWLARTCLVSRQKLARVDDRSANWQVRFEPLHGNVFTLKIARRFLAS